MIAKDVEGQALATLVINIAGKVLKACAVKAPGFGDEQGDLLEDIALLTGGKVIAKDKGGDLQNEGAESFGEAAKVVITKNKTTIIGGSGTESSVKERVELLRSQGIKLTVCTQKFESSAKKVLVHLNVYQYFDGFAYGDSTGVLKPDPKVFYHSVKGLGGGRYFYVGDTTIDLLLAKSVGASFLFHKKGYSPETLYKAGIDFSFDSFKELTSYYKKNLA